VATFRCSQLSQVWSTITFKQFNIEAYYLRWKMLSRKELSKNVRHAALATKGVPKCQLCCVLGLFLCIFPLLHTLHVLSTLFALISPLSHFTPPLPFPKEVNKKLSYRGQNPRSAWIKYTNVIPIANVYRIYPYAKLASLGWPDA